MFTREAGNIEFSTISTRAVLADNYKTRQIEFYDCRYCHEMVSCAY